MLSNSLIKLDNLVDSHRTIDSFPDDNNNNKALPNISNDQKGSFDYKSLYERLTSDSHATSTDKLAESVKSILYGEMPDAAKSIANSGKSICPFVQYCKRLRHTLVLTLVTFYVT